MKHRFYSVVLASLFCLTGMNVRADLTQDEEGIYQIGTAQDLVDFSTGVNGLTIPNTSSFVLTADIDMAGINFAPIGYVSGIEKPSYKDLDMINFKGNIDGQGHVIKNLTVVDTLYHESGLVSRLNGGTIKNLGIVNASITTNNPWGRAAAIAGFVNSNGHITNCFAAGEIELISTSEEYGQYATDQRAGLFCAGYAIVDNCYVNYGKLATQTYLSTFTNSYANVTETAPTGELAYTINENAGENIFYQKIGEDEYPTLNPERGIVYLGVDQYCDGTPKADVFYTNSSDAKRDAHNFVDGVCSVCHAPEADYMTPVDDVYQIGTAAQLRWFSAAVNTKLIANNVSAVLTEDIDMENDPFTPIGLYGDSSPNRLAFAGTIDGQGHVISNLTVVDDQKHEAGLTSRLTGTIKNLGIVNSNITTSNEYDRAGAFAGWKTGTLTNCYAYNVEFNVTGVSAAHYGGLFGGGNGTTQNCYTTYEKFAGYSNGTVTNTFANASETATTGELCYKLNQGAGSMIYYQNIGEDFCPVLDSTHGIVFSLGEGGFTSVTESTYSDFLSLIVNNETLFCEELIACQATIDEYLATVESWNDIATLADFLPAYEASKAVKQKVIDSQKVYQSYIDFCADYRKQLGENVTQSVHRDFLEAYLNPEDSQEPGDYPRGSYAYIIEMHTLTDAEIAEEIEYVTMLMNRVLINNPEPGTDMTVLLNNPAFYNNFDKWTVDATADMAVSSDKSVLPIGRARNGAFTVSQKIEGVPNGIYMVKVNSHAYAANNATLRIHTGEVFINENANLVMTPLDDAVAEAEAEDGVNCLFAEDEFIYDDVTDAAYYVPQNFKGCALSYSNGRYANYAAVEVKDSTITLGVRSMDYGNGNWMPFANFSLFYLGNAQEAAESLATVLEGFANRATTIYELENEYSLENGINITADLRQRIGQAIEEAQGETTGEQKLALMSRFTALFDEVYECRKAYTAMARGAELFESAIGVMKDKGTITEEEYNEYTNKAIEVWNSYVEGNLTPEQALALAKDLPKLIGTPDTDEEGNYLVGNANELVWFSDMLNSKVIPNTSNMKITADIDLASVANFAPIGFVSAIEKPSYQDLDVIEFKGNIDGQGHIISNLTVVDTLYHEAGLVSRLRGGTIKNLGVVNASVTSNNPWMRVSVIVGFVTGNGTLENCFATGNIELTGTAEEYGQFAHDGSGGLVGSVSGCIIKNCYITYGKLKGYDWGSTVINTFYGDDASGDKLTSGELAYNMNEKIGQTIYYQKIGEDQYPSLNPERGIVYIGVDQNCDGSPKGELVFSNSDTAKRDEHKIVDGICSVCGAYDPALIIDGVYQIGSANQLCAFAKLINTKAIANNTSAALTADIDLEGINFTPIALWNDNEYKIGYKGTFNGQGHIIKNLTINDENGNEAGLISRLAGGTVKNLGIVNADVTANNQYTRVGVIAGYVNYDGAWPFIDNCFTAGDIKLTLPNEVNKGGGIFGARWYCYMRNCYTTYESLNGTGQNDHYDVNDVNNYANPTEDQLKSGELAYTINEAAGDTIYYQTIGTDEFPVLDPTHGVVLKDADGKYYNAIIDAIEKVNTDARMSMKDAIFDLSGRRVKKAVKGIYIINGKKVLVK